MLVIWLTPHSLRPYIEHIIEKYYLWETLHRQQAALSKQFTSRPNMVMYAQRGLIVSVCAFCTCSHAHMLISHSFTRSCSWHWFWWSFWTAAHLCSSAWRTAGTSLHKWVKKRTSKMLDQRVCIWVPFHQPVFLPIFMLLITRGKYQRLRWSVSCLNEKPINGEISRRGF